MTNVRKYKKAAAVNARNDLPLVSVIMPFFNEERYIRHAIDSVIRQTYKSFELILVDDHSTDHSLEICRSFTDPRIRIYSNFHLERGPASARNFGVALAKGSYVMLHDADDLSHPTRLELQLKKALESPGSCIVGCAVEMVKHGQARVIRLPEHHEDIVKGFYRVFNRVTIVAGTMLGPTNIFRDVPYRARFKNMEDWDQVLRMHESGKVRFYNCPDALYTYYIRWKGSKWRPNWLDYNVFVRNSQNRRGRGLEEFSSLEAFSEYLGHHRVEGCKWLGLRWLIAIKQEIGRIRALGAYPMFE